MRAFVQTLVLALESPKKYYIHNNIFRYQVKNQTKSKKNENTGEKSLWDYGVINSL